MLKKFLSLLLAVMMIVSVLTVGFVTANAATTDGFTPDPGKLYFDTDGTGWEMGTKNKVAFHIFGGDIEKTLAWGASKSIGAETEGQPGVFEIDPQNGKQGYTLNPGVQYKIIFVRTDGKNWTNQTYDLFFTTDCFGHIAYSTGDMLENPVDSTKQALAAYWKDMDATKYGPVKAISSIGNVVGECLEKGKTDYDIMKEFFTEDKSDFQDKTGYQNAHKFKCEISETADGYKTEQKLIDDIGAGLGLTKDQVKEIIESDEVQAKFTATELGCSWSYDDSTLPAGSSAHTHTPGEPVIENDTPSTCKVAGTYDEVVYCIECGEEISRETKNHELAAHTPGEVQIENDTPSTCKVAGSYDEVVYCTACGDELSRETKNHELAAHTPGEVQIENEKAADCVNGGSYDEVVYCTACGDELSRETKNTDPDPNAHPALTHVEEVQPTASVDGVKEHFECPLCGKCFTDEAGTIEVSPEDLIIKAEHVRGDADGNGVFNSLDVTVLQRKLVDYDVESFDAIAADADLSGDVDVIDVTLMQRVLVKMTTFEKWDARHPKA